MCADGGDITLLLRAMKNGDEHAAEQLLPLVYNELHRLARSYMRRERADHTLQPTALINEAYLRLARENVDWQSRQHFIGFAANVMRHLLVDHARAHNAAMRAGDLERVELDEAFHRVADRRWADILATGKTVPWDDAKAWLDARSRGKHPRNPAARSDTTHQP